MGVSRYLNVGIDHGTTNSAVAYMTDKGPVVVPHGSESIMPSTVYYSKDGSRYIGAHARNLVMTTLEHDGEGHDGYKLLIGQLDTRYAFRAAGKAFSPADLGSMVIGELLNAYAQLDINGPRPKGCVVTIPAKFDAAQCEGTRKAAELAGLLYYPLLQEPVAAALSYGMHAVDKGETWMVFDMGGGTLDVTLVMLRGKEIIIPEEGNHGDNHLGGRFLDRELMDYVLQNLSEKYDLSNFSAETNPTAWKRLQVATETAKIELSKHENAVVHVPGTLCKDAKGRNILVEVPVTRREYVQRIGPIVQRAMNCCDHLLVANRLKKTDLQRIILVGGPTHTPYIRECLQRRYPTIPLDDSVDPMTCVAQGAAMYAVMQEYPADIWAMIKSESQDEEQAYDINIKAVRKSAQPMTPLTGAVVTEACDPATLTVEIDRIDGGWNSGRIKVDEDGMFEANLALRQSETPNENHFRVTVYDQNNQPVASIDEPHIWHPFPGAEFSLPSAMLVELDANKADTLVEGGVSLPCSEVGTYRTQGTIRKGSSTDVLEVPLLEALDNIFGQRMLLANCHPKVGTLFIKGNDAKVTRDIPAGSEIEVTVEIDTSRTIKLRAFVPCVGDEFEAEFQSSSYGISLDKTIEHFDRIQEDLKTVRNIQKQHPNPEVAEKLKFLDNCGELKAIATDIQRAQKGEREAEDRAFKRTLALAGGVEYFKKLQQPHRLAATIKQLREVAEGDLVSELDELDRQLQQAVAGGGNIDAVQEGVDKAEIEARLAPIGFLCLNLLSIQAAAKEGKLNLSNPAGLLAFTTGVDLNNEMQKKPNEDLTQADLQKVRDKNRELERYFTNLAELRQRYREANPGPIHATKLGK